MTLTISLPRPGVAALGRVVTFLFCAAVLPGAALAQGHGVASLKAAAGRAGPSVTNVASKAKPAAAPQSTKPTLVGTFGDWGTYVSQGAKSKVCYALGQPSARSPSSLKRETAYIFISNRPGEGVHNEVSIMTGVALKDGAAGAKAEIGSTSYELIAKGQNAFIKNAAEEGQFVGTLKRRGARLVVKIPAARSGSITDTYSLAGVSQALERVAKECP